MEISLENVKAQQPCWNKPHDHVPVAGYATPAVVSVFTVCMSSITVILPAGLQRSVVAAVKRTRELESAEWQPFNGLLSSLRQ